MCDAEAPACNGFGIFVVERQEKMKFAFQLAEIIYFLKGAFFISCLKAAKVRVGVRATSALECPNRRVLMFSAEGSFSARSLITTQLC